jgi:hypothetical protein
VRFTARAFAVIAGLVWIAQAHAQGAVQGIYTCVDASGRRLSSDRPIHECLDREQRVLNPSGTLNRRLSPSYTDAERAVIDEKARHEAEVRNRVIEHRQRQRALLTRYPSQELLERDRESALVNIDEMIATAQRRSTELLAERSKLDKALAAYAKDPSRAPAGLKHEIEESERQIKAHERQTADQVRERERIAQRFDEMKRQLDALWAQQAAVPPAR